MKNKTNNRLEQSIKPILILSQVLGITFFKKPKYLFAVYRLMILLLLIGLLIHEIPTATFWVTRQRSIHAMLAFAETCCRWCVLIIGFLITIIRNKSICDSVKDILETPILTDAKINARVNRMQYAHISCNLIFIICWNALGHTLLWENTNYKWYTLIIYVVTEFYIGFYNIQFVQLLLIVREYFKLLNKELEKLQLGGGPEKKTLLFSITQYSDALSVVKHRELHFNLCDLCSNLNKCFSIQTLLFVLLSTVEMTYSLRSFMLYIVSSSKDIGPGSALWIQRPWLEGALAFSWGGYYFTSLLQLVSSCDFTQSELQLFSLQLMNQNALFTAGRFFNLDFALLHSIVGAITTYLVIIVTFKE